MQLIPISDNVLINVDEIESIETREINGRKTFVIVVGGQTHIPTKNPDELLSLLIKGGMKMNDQFFSI